MHYLAFALLVAYGLQFVHSRPSNEIQVDDIIFTPEQLQFFERYKASRVVKSWTGYYWKKSILVYSFGKGLCKSILFLRSTPCKIYLPYSIYGHGSSYKCHERNILPDLCQISQDIESSWAASGDSTKGCGLLGPYRLPGQIEPGTQSGQWMHV